MDLSELAATAAAHPVGTLVLAGLTWACWYTFACWWWPFVSCGWCEGGKRRAPGRRAWRPCPRCKGKGRKVRLGRRMWRGAGCGAAPDSTS